jgi:preprotein translocase subunit YajC
MELVQLLVFLVLMGAIFYFLLIRPERRRRQQHQELIESLKRGDRVITMGGICGVIKKVDKDRVWLEVEDGVTIKLLKDSVVEREKA